MGYRIKVKTLDHRDLTGHRIHILLLDPDPHPAAPLDPDPHPDAGVRSHYCSVSME